MRIMTPAMLAAACIHFAASDALSAQRPPPSLAPATFAARERVHPFGVALQERPSQEHRPPTIALLTLGVLGSAAGAMAGGWLGYELDRARGVPSEDPGLIGALVGGLAGSVVGSTAAVYWTDDRRGSEREGEIHIVGGRAQRES